MLFHRTVHDLPTPALLLDLDILERNAARMAGKVHGLGAALRPHVKTHKCIEVGALQRRHGAQGITVATIVEARDFATHGFDDITWAVPLPVSRLDEVIEVARQATLRLTVDSVEAADALAAAARRAGLKLHVWLEVDCGYHRSGVDPEAEASLALARRLADNPHLDFDGVLTHGGHAYAARTDAERRDVARAEREVTAGFAGRLREAGIRVSGVSVGSTPTMAAADSLEGVTEARPGNYIFYDYMQAAVGVCRPEDVAVSVLATVISRRPELPHVIVDAGALAMSKDAGPQEHARGLGPLYRGLAGPALEPALTLAHVSQEHGFVEGPAEDLARLRVGTRVRVMPNHSCLTAAMFDAYDVVRGETIVDRWTIHRGR